MTLSGWESTSASVYGGRGFTVVHDVPRWGYLLLNEKARQYINEIESLYNIIILSYIVPWGPELDLKYHQYQRLIVRMKTNKKQRSLSQLVDWSIVLCFTPYRQYFSHVKIVSKLVRLNKDIYNYPWSKGICLHFPDLHRK